MKRSTVILALLLVFSHGYSQKIHSTDEIFKIMNDSKLGYQIETLKEPIASTDYSDRLNHPSSYRIVSDSTIRVYQYKLNDQASIRLKKAEDYYNTKDYENALLWYKSTLEADSTFYLMFTYIGQISN